MDRIWGQKTLSVPLNVRLRDAAMGVRDRSLARLLLAVCASALALLVLPNLESLTWTAGALALELWVWRATQPFGRDQKITRAVRINVWLSVLGLISWWMLLGLMFWLTGDLVGQACAMVLLLTVVVVAVVRFVSTPAIFVALGAFPAIGSLLFIAMKDGHTWLELIPILMALSLSVIFGLGRAIRTPSAEKQQEAINASLRQLQILTDNISDVIVRTDVEGVHTYVSPSVERVLGYRPEDLVGTPRADYIAPDDLHLLDEAGEQMEANPDRSAVVTCRVRHKDGRWLWMQTSARMLYEHGVPVAVIDVSRDITEQVAMDIALREAKAQAESANQATADFLANVSHEIRTPMNGVLGALHLLEREPVSLEGRELMRQASDCGRMLSQLLNDVLDFSKIEAGQLDLTPEPVDVGDALTAVVSLLRDQANAKGVELRSEIVGDRFWITADPVRLRQMMFNLVGNAIKFTSQGYVAARLTVEPTADGQQSVRLEIEDTGIGIPQQAQASLFDRFRQAEGSNARRFGGTGLGLTITQALARMMNGDVGFTSTEGEGSTFWLEFTVPPAEPISAEPEEEGFLGGVRILLVEDNATNRLVARTLLTRLGAQVDVAADGVAGLEQVRAASFDLVLMDVQMPNMDGLEATRAVRALPGAVSGVPIIGLTANVMTHQLAAYMAAGMNGVVAKPISVPALITEIARVLSEDASTADA